MIMPRHARQRGVTLVELIIVIVLMGIISATLTIFIKPAMDSFSDTRVRADMADQSDTALRRMLRDVRRAVPNSLRVPSDQCFELVPLVSGGRYRMGPDLGTPGETNCTPSDNGVTASCSAWVDPSQATTTFDVLSTMSVTPIVGDYVVINNQNGNDVYTGANTRTIASFPTNTSTQGTKRITLSSSIQVSPGYTGGRFQTVSQNEQSVFYICSGADNTLNASGNGKGTLYRLVRGFNSTYPSACPATTGAVVLATNVKYCSFIYNANQGSTQQSGFLWMNLEIARNNEVSKMVVGAHVMNVP